MDLFWVLVEFVGGKLAGWQGYVHDKWERGIVFDTLIAGRFDQKTAQGVAEHFLINGHKVQLLPVRKEVVGECRLAFPE
jgi:hypothetical protein